MPASRPQRRQKPPRTPARKPPPAAVALAGIGCDVVEVDRLRRELARPDGGFRDDVFTPSEIAYCAGKRWPERHFAARFAAKEALLKALGTGARRWSAWREVEVVRDGAGAPSLTLHGRVHRRSADLGVRRVRVSLAHTATVAMASVVLET